MNKGGFNCQELYDCVKKDPNAIVMDVGEPHPCIIHEADMVVTYKDGSVGRKTVYTTFEFVKRHLKKLKACDCEGCQGAVASYRVNKKTMRALQRGEEIEALIPDGWVRDYDH
jgi:hypothetical protein